MGERVIQKEKKERERESNLELSKHVGLGSSGDSSGAVCAVKPRAIVSTSREEQSGGVWEHADKWVIHTRPHHHFLWPHNYLPHRCWCSHLYWMSDLC